MNLFEILAICFLSLVLGGFSYGIVMLIINGLLSSLKLRFKLPIQKRFINKITPIYRLSTQTLIDNEIKRIYFIQKWELEYVDIEIGSWQTIWIPFSSLFQRLHYVGKEQFNIGVLSEDVIENLNLEQTWNEHFNKWDDYEKLEEEKRNKFKQIMNNLNEDFNKNYTE